MTLAEDGVAKGRLLILYVEDSPGAGTYSEVAGCTSNGFSFGSGLTNNTETQRAATRSYDTEFGHQSLDISLTAHGKQNETLTQIQGDAIARTTRNYRIISETGYQYDGAFVPDGAAPSGQLDQAEGWSFTLLSDGEITFTPATIGPAPAFHWPTDDNSGTTVVETVEGLDATTNARWNTLLGAVWLASDQAASTTAEDTAGLMDWTGGYTLSQRVYKRDTSRSITFLGISAGALGTSISMDNNGHVTWRIRVEYVELTTTNYHNQALVISLSSDGSSATGYIHDASTKEKLAEVDLSSITDVTWPRSGQTTTPISLAASSTVYEVSQVGNAMIWKEGLTEQQIIDNFQGWL